MPLGVVVRAASRRARDVRAESRGSGDGSDSLEPVNVRYCDERGPEGFSWIVEEPATRTSHALAADGRVWLVDPVSWPEAIERAVGLGVPAAVVQLLDRHSRDCASVAAHLGVPHLRVPAELPGTPLQIVVVRRTRRWRESAVWWRETRTLVVAEAVGTNIFFTGGRGRAGVHLLLRPTPPRDALGGFQPDHLLVGHGEGLHGTEAAEGLHDALADARTGLPRVLLRIPALLADARRRRR